MQIISITNKASIEKAEGEKVVSLLLPENSLSVY